MAEYNSTNLTSEFAGPATPTNAIPNDDIDSALGYSRDPNDDFMTAFGKAFQAGQFRNTDEGRKLTAEFAKQKLNNQLALQLEERKQQLAQKYKPYEQFIHMPNGAIWGVGQQGATKLSEDPEQSKLWTAKTAAEVAKANFEASPEHIKALQEEDRLKPLTAQSQIDANEGLAAYRPLAAKEAQARAEAATHPPVHPTEWTPEKEKQLQEAAVAALYPGYKPGKPFSNRQFYNEQKVDPAAVQAKIKAKMEELRPTFSSSSRGGIAQPAQAAPDLTGAFGPLQVE